MLVVCVEYFGNMEMYKSLLSGDWNEPPDTYAVAKFVSELLFLFSELFCFFEFYISELNFTRID